MHKEKNKKKRALVSVWKQPCRYPVHGGTTKKGFVSTENDDDDNNNNNNDNDKYLMLILTTILNRIIPMMKQKRTTFNKSKWPDANQLGISTHTTETLTRR